MKLIWKSPTPFNKGASQQQKNLAASQAKFYDTLTKDYGVMFQGSQEIIKSLKDSATAIFAKGIDQYGFSTPEDTAIRTQASDAIARNFASAQTALNENLASRGGGNTFLPSGATAQLETSLLGQEATTQAETSNQITQAGYSLGRQNYLSAANILGTAAGLDNPASILGGANTAGSNAFDSATKVSEANKAAAKVLGGIIGGAAGSFIGMPEAGAQLGAGLGGAFG